MASYEIEKFLIITFDKGVAKSTIHKGKLVNLNILLGHLSKSTAFFDEKNTRGYLYDLKNSLDECLRLSRKWFPVLIHPAQYYSVGKSLGEMEKNLLDYRDPSGPLDFRNLDHSYPLNIELDPYMIEKILVATFDEGVTKSKIHKRQFARINILLKELSKSNAFFEVKNPREYLHDLTNTLDECVGLSRRWVRMLIHPLQYGSIGKSLREMEQKLISYQEYLGSSQVDPAAADASQEGTPAAAAAAVEGKKIHGFMEELVAVERLVVVPGQQDGFKAVGIAGNAGVGKTTLCKELLKRQEVRDLYVPRIYVHLPDREQVVENDYEQEKSQEDKDNDKSIREGYERKVVLVKILEMLGLEKQVIVDIQKGHNVDAQPGVKEETVEKIPKEKNVGRKSPKEKYDEWHLAEQSEKIQKIKEELSRLACAVYAQLIGKKYLIVLDNVTSDAKWFEKLAAKRTPQEHEWGDSLAYALPKGYGGTVLVTSRRLKLVNKMVKVDANVHRLVPRANKDFILNMFEDSVHKQGLQFDNDKPLEKEIIKKCAGIPLAAKMMGEIMQKIDPLKELLEALPTEKSTENTTAEGLPPVESTENTTAKEPPSVESTENKTAEEEQSKASTSEIQEAEQPKESQEEEDEDEHPDGVPPSDEE